MDQVYILMLIALGILAITDLMVGVANDAVNFLNSSIGSKAVSFKTIMIVASLGVAVGALFSSGMMEIARSGIFTPSMFSFDEVMIIFLAVMITDVILLDIFNTLGLPTSTTVSIIFSLLGASVFIAIFKIFSLGDDMSTLEQYINTKKASEIVYSIFLSVLLSFTLGSIVQYISRLIFTFHLEKRYKYAGALFGGLALTAITFFILVKGLKSATFLSSDAKDWIKDNQGLIILYNAIFWTITAQFLMSVIKMNIFKFIIIVGTFALALAFAGNDLVNFIGVPIAAYQSYEFYAASGQLAQDFKMTALGENDIVAPIYFLVLAGFIMVFTLWRSKKAKNVVETEMSLSRQGEGSEKYDSNRLSRYVVRGAVGIGNGLNYIIPKALQDKIDRQFEKPAMMGKLNEQPAFDLVRASVNLIVASILISIGTSMKLPLSTTYVTFMVAMGSSFADRAWDRESAVYRIAGVFNVIGGWFVTALAAFLFSGLVGLFLIYGEVYAVVVLLIFVALFFYRSNQVHNKKEKAKEELKKLKREDIVTINEIINESSHQVSQAITNTKVIYSDVIANLGLQDLNKLKENRKNLKKVEKEIDELKNNVYFFIKNLDETSLEASKFYVIILGYLQDIAQSLNFITQNSFSHVNNNHKQLKFNQIRDLKLIDTQLRDYFEKIGQAFENKDFDKIDLLLLQKDTLLSNVSDLIQKQIIRIRTTETSPKNSKLYFGLLLETNDLIKSTISLLELFKEFHHHVKTKKK